MAIKTILMQLVCCSSIHKQSSTKLYLGNRVTFHQKANVVKHIKLCTNAHAKTLRYMDAV